MTYELANELKDAGFPQPALDFKGRFLFAEFGKGRIRSPVIWTVIALGGVRSPLLLAQIGLWGEGILPTQATKPRKISIARAQR